MEIPSRYTPLGETFSGGMGEVSIYLDENLQRKVAIKQSRDFVDRTQDEVKALKSNVSKHVVEIFDILEDLGEIAIVEEYVSGKDFCFLGEPFDKDAFLKTVFQVASGISELHEIDIIHRDLKPSNMKFDNEGILKIFDFGLARQFGVDSATCGFRGSLWYAAPELYQDGTIELTPSLDVYAFGVICIEYALGKLPAELTTIRQNGPALTPYMDLLENYLSNYLLELFDRALEYDPSLRPEMSELKFAIENNILFDRHRALFAHNGEVHYIDATKREATLSVANKGSITIQYTGLDFIVKALIGDIKINNQVATENMLFSGACVVSFGNGERDRVHITFDISHPGVVL